MQLSPSAHQPLAKIRRQRLGIAFTFSPFVLLAEDIGIDLSLVCEIAVDRAVNSFEPQQVEILTNRLWRFAAAECMDDRIEKDAGGYNVEVP